MMTLDSTPPAEVKAPVPVPVGATAAVEFEILERVLNDGFTVSVRCMVKVE